MTYLDCGKIDFRLVTNPATIWCLLFITGTNWAILALTIVCGLCWRIWRLIARVLTTPETQEIHGVRVIDVRA